MNNKATPPKRALIFFRWFCKPEYQEDLEGDLLESFERRQEEYGKFKANVLFVLDILQLFRPTLVRIRLFKPFSFNLLQHHVLIFFRVTRRNPFHFLLNLMGLTLGTGAFLLILFFVLYERSFDRFHFNNQNIYRVNYFFSRAEASQRAFASAPANIAPYIKSNFPEVKSYVRVGDAGEGTIAFEDRKFREKNILFADSSFFSVFSYDLVQGNEKTCLSGANKMVISESMAQKYFQYRNPVGQVVSVDGTQDKYVITGVFRDPPENSHLKFDILLSYWWYDSEDSYSWYSPNYHSYIVLESGVDIDLLTKKLNDIYQLERNEINRENNFIQEFQLQKLTELHFNSNLENELRTDIIGDTRTLRTLLIIGILILLMAWINYINLSTARATQRTREVGIRKSLGADRKNLMYQFVSESFMINAISLSLAMLFVILNLETFNSFFGTNLTSQPMRNFFFLGGFLILLIIGTYAAGWYPALIISSLKPSKIINADKGQMGFRDRLRKILVILQFSTSASLITGAFIMYQQIDHLASKDLGFNDQNILIIRTPNIGENSQHGLYTSKLQEFTDINEATLSEYIPGEVVAEPANVKRKRAMEKPALSFNVFHVGHGFFKTMDIKMIAGREFASEVATDTYGVIINRKAAKLLNYSQVTDAVGNDIIINEKHERKIVGVVDDFDQITAKQPTSPMVYAFDPDWGNYFIVRFNEYASARQHSEEIYQELFPNDAFEYFILDEFFGRQYLKENSLFNLIGAFTLVAVFIACLGLFGLVHHYILSRKKEIGIRKVFGANLKKMFILLSKEHMTLIAASIFISMPVVYLIMEDWLNDFAYRIEINTATFFNSNMALVLISCLIIGSFAVKASNTNPIEVLRDE